MVTSTRELRPDVRIAGDGPPLVLVHGSFADASAFDELATHLQSRFTVVSYDRRGHGTRIASEPAVPPVGLDVEAGDLAGLVDDLGLGPVTVVGGSTGGSIGLFLLAHHPDRVHAVLAHEPPAFELAAGRTEVTDELGRIRSALPACARLLAEDRTDEGCALFVDRVLLLDGRWAGLAGSERERMRRNAAAWLHGRRDGSGPDPLPIATLGANTRPAVITRGEHCPATYAAIVDELDRRIGASAVRVVPGAGHLPHVTHPAGYADLIIGVAGRPPE